MEIPVFLTVIQKEFQQIDQERQALVGRANAVLRQSKRAIFALHRDDRATAASLLKEAGELIQKMRIPFKRFPDLSYEGSYRAALEEYAEARLVEQFLLTGKFKRLSDRFITPAIYLGALSDATGELVRYAVSQATQGKIETVDRVRETVEMAVEYFLRLDLTGSLRQKNDQARKNLQSLEKIQYDLHLRDR